MVHSVEKRVAELYDASVPDWPGEIDFYRALAAEAKRDGLAVLEVACGTGRVALRLARMVCASSGSISRRKCWTWPGKRRRAAQRALGARPTCARLTWGDVRAGNHPRSCLPEPAYPRRTRWPAWSASSAISSPMGCWSCTWTTTTAAIWAGWGALSGEKKGVFERAQEVRHPETGRLIHVSRAWSYEASTQTASVVTAWEELDAEARSSTGGKEVPSPCTVCSASRWNTCWPGSGWRSRACTGTFAAETWRTTRPRWYGW